MTMGRFAGGFPRIGGFWRRTLRVRETDTAAPDLSAPATVLGPKLPADGARIAASSAIAQQILASGRGAEAVILAATAVSRPFGGDAVFRLDLELRSWDEPRPWRVRLEAPVPMALLHTIELGRRLSVAFIAVDQGQTVAVDWDAAAE